MNYQVVAKVADFLPDEISVIASKHFTNCNFKELKRYSEVISSPQGVYAFISALGELFYLTETRCPFEPTDVVYVLDCQK